MLEDVLLEEPAPVSVPVVVFGFVAGSTALAGSVAFGETAGVLSVYWPITEKPVRPWISSLVGSRPSGDPFFRPSTPRICGRSSRFIGLTRCAVTMNINSVSFFWNDFDV